nr:hypothetical protein [uncultured Desulfuromonas sp.]
MIDPALLRLTLEKSLRDCCLHYRDNIYQSGTRHRFASIPLPDSIRHLEQSISSCPKKEPFRRLDTFFPRQAVFFPVWVAHVGESAAVLGLDDNVYQNQKNKTGLLEGI